MYSEEEFAKLIQSNTLSKAIESIDRMNETLRKGSVISLKIAFLALSWFR